MVNSIHLTIFIILLMTLIYDLFFEEHSCHSKKLKKENYTFDDYVTSAHSGLLRGFLFGMALNNFDFATGVRNGIVFGCTFPILMHIGY